MVSIGILLLLLVLIISLLVRFKQTDIMEFFENGRQPTVYDRGNININMILPKYSVNANMLLENGTLTATYNTAEKRTGKTYSNYQVFSQDLLIKDGDKYYVANMVEPQTIFQLGFEEKKITKSVISETDFDRIYNAVNNYITTKVNLVGPNEDVAPATGFFNDVETPAKVPARKQAKNEPKPMKSKKDTLKEASSRIDKPDKNKLLNINYYNDTDQYIQLDKNRNMLETNKEGVTYNLVCDKTQGGEVKAANNAGDVRAIKKVAPKKKTPPRGKPGDEMAIAKTLQDYEDKLDKKLWIESQPYYKAERAQQCIQYMALKNFQTI